MIYSKMMNWWFFAHIFYTMAKNLLILVSLEIRHPWFQNGHKFDAIWNWNKWIWPYEVGIIVLSLRVLLTGTAADSKLTLKAWCDDITLWFLYKTNPCCTNWEERDCCINITLTTNLLEPKQLENSLLECAPCEFLLEFLLQNHKSCYPSHEFIGVLPSKSSLEYWSSNGCGQVCL